MKKILSFIVIAALLLLSSCTSATTSTTETETKTEDTAKTEDAAKTETKTETEAKTDATTKTETDTKTDASVKVDTSVKADVKATTPEPITLSMESGNLFFKPTSLTVKQNQKVTINFKNAGFHTFTIDDLGVNVDLQSSSNSVTFTPTKKGTFTFVCKVPGHGSMKGTITVE